MMLKPLEPFRRPLTGQAAENSHAMDTCPPVNKNTRQYDEKDKDKAKMEFTLSLSVDVTETRGHNYNV